MVGRVRNSYTCEYAYDIFRDTKLRQYILAPEGIALIFVSTIIFSKYIALKLRGIQSPIKNIRWNVLRKEFKAGICLTIFTKCSMLDVCQISEYVSVKERFM